MVVFIDEVGDKGLKLEKELGREFLSEVLAEEDPALGFRPTGTAQLVVFFEKLPGKIFLEGKTTLPLKVACKRCLAEVELKLPISFRLFLVSTVAPRQTDLKEKRSSGSRDEEGLAASFDIDSADEEAFDGKQIDLSSIIREQILLSLPMDWLCKEECKGLCAICGKDLNVDECGCERRASDPRWAALKDMKV